MATKEQIEAAREYMQNSKRVVWMFPDDVVSDIIDAALAVPVEYSDEQVELIADHYDAETCEGMCSSTICLQCLKRALKAAGVPAQSTGTARAVKAGSPLHVEFWDAVNEYAESCGGRMALGSVRRMTAVAGVERALEAFLAARRERSEPEAKAAAPVDRTALTKEERQAIAVAMADMHNLGDERQHAARVLYHLLDRTRAASVLAAPADGREAKLVEPDSGIKWTGEYDDHGMPIAAEPEPSEAVVTTWSEDDYALHDDVFMRMDAEAEPDDRCLRVALDAVQPKLRAAYDAGYKAGFKAGEIANAFAEDEMRESIEKFRAERTGMLVEPLSASELALLEVVESDLATREYDTVRLLDIIRKRFPTPAPVAAPKRTARELADAVRRLVGWEPEDEFSPLDELVSRLQRLEGEAGR